MITIKIPVQFFNERKYIFEYLFKDIYKTEYFITNSDSLDTSTIVLDNGSKIFIEDHFFKNFEDLDLNNDSNDKTGSNNNYIHYKNIPKRIQLCKNEFAIEENIPLIFGKNEIISSPTQIVCKIDIVSSLFFLISRWEEIAITSRDEHGRFSEMDSLLFRSNLLNRPVANEYIEMLWNLILKLDPDVKNKKSDRVFKVSLSHDIDELRKYKNKFQILKKLTADLVKRLSIKDFFTNLYEVIQISLGKIEDPYCSFDSLMNLSEEINEKSTFFFKTGGNSIFDRNKYNIDIDSEAKAKISEIIDRGHEIALHYSYLSVLDKIGNEQKKIYYVKREKKDLENSLINIFTSNGKGKDERKELYIKSERVHFLRFSVDTSFNKLNDIGITKDFSMGFSGENGFRAGICYEYPVWNFDTREKFKDLTEYPLILMDTVLLNSKEYSIEEQKNEIQYFYNIVRRYNGNFTFLIHNSTDNKFLDLVYEVINTN